jgi:hypothetical protein
VEPIRRAEYDRFHVTFEEGGMDIIGADRDDFFAKIERVERLDHHLAALVTLEFVGTGVFEIRHHMIDWRFGRVGGILMEFQVMTRIGHFGARNNETSAFF